MDTDNSSAKAWEGGKSWEEEVNGENKGDMYSAFNNKFERLYPT